MNDKSAPPEFTTAQALAALNAELLAEGFDREAALDIVMVFVRESAGEGFCVKARPGVAA